MGNERRSGFWVLRVRSRFDLVGVGNCDRVLFLAIGDRGLIWLGLEMRSGFRFVGWAIALLFG